MIASSRSIHLGVETYRRDLMILRLDRGSHGWIILKCWTDYAENDEKSFFGEGLKSYRGSRWEKCVKTRRSWDKLRGQDLPDHVKNRVVWLYLRLKGEEEREEDQLGWRGFISFSMQTLMSICGGSHDICCVSKRGKDRVDNSIILCSYTE